MVAMRGGESQQWSGLSTTVTIAVSVVLAVEMSRWMLARRRTRVAVASDPAMRETERIGRRVDDMAALIAGFYASEGLPVPAVLQADRASRLSGPARIRRLRSVPRDRPGIA